MISEKNDFQTKLNLRDVLPGNMNSIRAIHLFDLEFEGHRVCQA